MHWNGYGKGHQQTGTTTIYFQPDAEGYITSGLLWLPGLAVFYVNGREVLRWETPRISNVPSDIMFTNVSGGWDNNAIDDAALPDDFVIDYVRAWQRKDLASDADGFQPQPTPSAPEVEKKP
jgi:beta-glucanase (GH16 family)